MENFTTVEDCKEFLLKTPQRSELTTKALSRMDELGATFEDYQDVYDCVNYFSELDAKLKQIALANFERKVSASDKDRLHFC